MMAMMMVFWIVVVAFFVKWFATDARRALPEHAERTAAEMARLRDEVDRLATQVDRLTEEQSFMVRLLSDGERRSLAVGPDPLEVPDAVPEPHPQDRAGPDERA